MIETTRTETNDADLPGFLRARARAASDTRLVADAVVGFIAAITCAIWQFPSWHLGLAASACFFAFGVWGIAERELTDREASAPPRLVRVLHFVQNAAAIAGAVAAAGLAIGVMAILIGRVIS